MQLLFSPKNSVITIAKGDSRSQLFTAYAPQDFEAGSKTVTVTVTSEDGIFTETFDVVISKASIKLYINQGAIVTLSDNVADTAGKLVIPVTNEGSLESSDVIVSASIVGGKSLGSKTITLGANSTSNAEFDMLAEDSSGNVRFSVVVEVAGDDSVNVEQQIGVDGSNEIDFSVEYYITQDTEDSPWFTLVIFLLGALVIYGGIKVSRSNSKSARF